MAGTREKKVTKRIANTTRKVVSSAKESTQRSRSKLDTKAGDTGTKTSGKRTAGGTANKNTGRGTEVSNKTLEKRTKRGMKETLSARKKDEASAAKKKATKKQVKKTVAKRVLKSIPVVGAIATAAEAVGKLSPKKKPTTKGQMGRVKRK